MKKIRLKRWISMILSVALVVRCIYVSEPMETEAATATKFDEITTDFNPGTDIIAGDVLVSEDFSDVEVGALPTGWQDHVGSWMYAAGSNTVGVKQGTSDKYLHVLDNNGTTAIIFPSAGAANYVVTANVTLDSTGGAVGLVTNIEKELSTVGTSAANAVTHTYYDLNEGKLSIKNRYNSYDNPQGDARYYAIPEDLVENLTTGSEVQFTACCYKSWTYFYVNNIYIGKIQRLDKEMAESLCGLYVCGGTSGFSLNDVTISELVRDTSADIRSQVTVLENKVTVDFSKLTETTLPHGWRLVQDSDNRSWLWNGGNSSATIEKGVGLRLSSNRDGALLAPSLGTSDYVMKATIKCGKNANYLGVLTNVIDPVEQSTSATKSYIQMEGKGAEIIQENRVGSATPTDTQRVSTTEILETLPVEGTELELMVYSFKGYTYFYVNGVFVQKIAQKSPQLEKSLCGFYVASTNMLIIDVTIDAIAKVGDISRKVYATETLLTEDFSQVEEGGLPDQWEILQDKWIMVKENVGHADVVKVTTDSTKKYLNMYDDDGAVGLILPALGTSDYVLTANIIPTTDKGTVGLMTNIKEPLSKAEGATHSILSLKGAGDKVEQFWRKGTANYDYQSALASTSIGKLLGQGDSIKLTVYSYQGYSYFYVNDMFVCYTAHRNAELETSMCGLYICGTSIKVNSVSVRKIEAKGETSAAQMLGAAVRYADADGVARGAASSGMRFVASVDKDSFLYRTSDNVELGMIVRPADDLNIGDNITLETEGIVDFPLDEIVSENDKAVQYATTLMGLLDLDEYYAARAYMKVDGEYYYSNQIKRSQARLATRLASDDNMIDENIETKLNSIFDATEGYLKANEVKTLDFTVLGDLHYKEGMYAATIEDLTTILNRATENNSSFVMHMGDFCNDYKGSVELTNTYLASVIPVYGVYGNHELESANNSMDYVTPLLTNQKDNVVWGTESKKIEDGSIGYYYFDDESGFRVVCTDSNYSWSEANQEWQHNTTNSYGSPTGNTKSNSLGDAQLVWLENVLTDAAQKDIPCVVVSHATMSGSWEPSPDSQAVQTIFRRVNTIQEGTVLLALNGHNHQDHMKIIDDVVYIDINTVRNGFWNGSAGVHYTDEHTFNYVKYNADGSVASTQEASLNVLSSGGSTWFFEEPVSANIRISTAGYIHVDGFETTWMYGVEPDVSEAQARVPWISDYKIDFLY